MDWRIAVLLFFLNILDDALGVFFTRRVVAGKVVQAAILSGLLTFIISISVVNYVENRWYLIPIVIGSAVGTFLAIKLDKYLRRKQNAKKRLQKAGKGHIKADKGIPKTSEAQKEQKGQVI